MLNKTQIWRSLFIFNALLVCGYIYTWHIHPYRMYYHDALAILGLIFMLGSFASVSKIRLLVPKIVIVPFMLIVVIGIQLMTNLILYPADVIFPILYLICFIVALICGATIATESGGLTMMCNAFGYSFIVGGIISVILQNLQLLDLNLLPWVNALDWNNALRPYANLAQPNLLALVLCFALASIWYIYSLRKIKPAFATAIAIILLWGLALTQSRIAWIILPLFVLFCWNAPADRPSMPKYLMLVLAILFVGFVLYVPGFLHFCGGVGDSVENRAGQTSVRLVLWQQAWAMSLAHPWIGVGWFQFGRNQVLIAEHFKPTEYSDYAHNILLNFAAEIGWPLTLLLVVGSLVWVYHCFIKTWASIHVRFLGLIFASIAVHSMVEFPLWYSIFLMPFGVMIGALNTGQMGAETIQISRVWIITFCLVSLTTMTAITWDYNRVVKGFTAIRLIQAGEISDTSTIKKPAFTLFPQFFDYFHIIEIPVTPKMQAKDIDFLELMAVRFAFGSVLNRLAIVYIDNQRPAEALMVLTILQRLNMTDYVGTYGDWKGFAKKNPDLYGEVFKRMPKPNAYAIKEKD
jgi:O-antigen ligase